MRHTVASGTKLYAVHIAFVGGGGGLYYAIKVSQVGKKPNSDTQGPRSVGQIIRAVINDHMTCYNLNSPKIKL